MHLVTIHQNNMSKSYQWLCSRGENRRGGMILVKFNLILYRIYENRVTNDKEMTTDEIFVSVQINLSLNLR